MARANAAVFALACILCFISRRRAARVYRPASDSPRTAKDNKQPASNATPGQDQLNTWGGGGKASFVNSSKGIFLFYKSSC